MNKKYYLTTAIAYSSAKPHIGNTYEIVLGDAIARFKRLEGYDVYFQTGTDEHGEKIEIKAHENGINPQEYVDNVSKEIKDVWDIMETSYDKFIRTTDSEHKKTVQKIFTKLYQQGDIYKSNYEGLYCVFCESFWTETQAENGLCPDCGRPVTHKSEEAYFFKLSKYQDRLIDYIENHPDFIKPESRKNEMINNFLKPGLQDLCISRSSFKWGIPVPLDENHVIYVWLDALSNYITFIGYDPENENSTFNELWPCDLHLVGKDIIRFHTIYWPIILMALNLPLPKQVYGHPWLLSGNDKMSKSKGNVLYADELTSKYGVDRVRYYLLHEIPFANDGSITEELLIEKCNADLSNILGNLVTRTISMANKYFDGQVVNGKENDSLDEELAFMASTLLENVTLKMNEFKVAEGLELIINVARRCNKYIDETMPWILAKDEDKTNRLKTVLYNLLETIRICAVILQAFIPSTATKILDLLQVNERDFSTVKSFGKMTDKFEVKKAEIIFERLESNVNR